MTTWAVVANGYGDIYRLGTIFAIIFLVLYFGRTDLRLLSGWVGTETKYTTGGISNLIRLLTL